MSDSTTVAGEPEAERTVDNESAPTAPAASDQLSIIIQGEVHGSQKDMRALLSEDLEEYDALFVEGRENVIALDEADSIGFRLFAIGFLLLRLSVYPAVDLFSRFISLLIGREPGDPEGAEEGLRECLAPVWEYARGRNPRQPRTNGLAR